VKESILSGLKFPVLCQNNFDAKQVVGEVSDAAMSDFEFASRPPKVDPDERGHSDNAIDSPDEASDKLSRAPLVPIAEESGLTTHVK
jgi:hypothetical protein